MQPYHYIGTNFNLEPTCVTVMDYLKEPSTLEDCIDLMEITEGDVELMFPRIENGHFYTSEFDNLPCVVYELLLGKGMYSRTMQFVWLRLD